MALDYAEPQHQRWVARLRFHHLVNDATSTTLLMDEIRAHLLGQQAQLPVPVPYRNMVAQARSTARQAAHEAFFRGVWRMSMSRRWRSAYRNVRPCVPRPKRRSARSATRSICACAARPEALGVSAASLFHLAWAQVLSRVAGREDVVFGTVLLGRLQAGEGRAGLGHVYQYLAAAPAPGRAKRGGCAARHSRATGALLATNKRPWRWPSVAAACRNCSTVCSTIVTPQRTLG